MSKQKAITATVNILTFNGEQYIGEILAALRNQKTSFEYEVLVIDSGSTDRTLEIIAEFPEVRLHEIPNSEFGHGKTRNLAAELAKGEFVVYITHDATPASEHWLEEMVRPFAISDDIVAVLGKQVPRHDCVPVVKREIVDAFNTFGPDQMIILSKKSPLITDQASIDTLTFYSDVNSAMRKSINAKIPYQNVSYAEDQAFGRDVIDAGLIKAYAPKGAVFHSHNYNLKDYFRRKYDEAVGLFNATGQRREIGLKELTLGSVKGTLLDIRFTLRDVDYSAKAKIKWVALAPFYNFGWRFATRLAAKPLSPGVMQYLSLESQARKKAAKED